MSMGVSPAGVAVHLLLAALASAAAPAARAPAAAAPAARAPAAAAPARAILVVEVSGFRSDHGKALVALYASKEGFPDKVSRAVRRAEVPIAARRARVQLRDLPPGTYAVAVLHDEDGDHKMKTGWFGRPKEGYGASRDARGHLGPPRFDDAKLALRGGTVATVRIRMEYP